MKELHDRVAAEVGKVVIGQREALEDQAVLTRLRNDHAFIAAPAGFHFAVLDFGREA